MTLFTVNIDKTAMVLDNAIGGGQSQSCAAAHLFSGKEGVEYTFLSLFIHTGPCIGNRHLDVFPRLHMSMFGLDPFQIEIICFQINISAARHGLPRVHKDVQEYLFQLHLIDFNRPEIVCVFFSYDDLFFCPAEHTTIFFEYFIEIHRLKLIFSASGEP